MITITPYFEVKELVCKHVYNKYGERAIQFLDSRLLETIVAIRKKIDKPIYVNNWDSNGQLSQRGLRCNLCSLVRAKSNAQTLYVSAHLQGTAIDFDVKGMTASEVRKWIQDHADVLPYPVRLEDEVTWVHLDLRNDGSKSKVVLFKA